MTPTNIGTYGHHMRPSSQNRLAANTRDGSLLSRRKLVECLRWIRFDPRRPADRWIRVVRKRMSSHPNVSGALATPLTRPSSLSSVTQPT